MMKIKLRKARFKATFSFCGFRLEVHSDNQHFFDLALTYFQHLQSFPARSTDKRIDFYLIEQKNLFRNRWDLDNWDKGNYTLESWSRDITVRVNFKQGIIRSFLSSQCKFPKEVIEDLLIVRPLRLILKHHGFLSIHAGCVVKNGQGIIIPSAFGKGKTLITLYLLHQGFRFLGDEYIVLNKSPGKVRAFGLPERIGIRKRQLSLFPELGFLKERKDSPRRKKRFWIEEAYPNSIANCCSPKVILFPFFKREARLSLARLNIEDALANILADRDNLFSTKGLASNQGKGFEILSSLMQQAVAYQLIYSDKYLNSLAKNLERAGLFKKS